MARKPSALARELVRNFPKGKRKRKNKASRTAAADRAAMNGRLKDDGDVLEAIDSPETGELIDPAELEDAGMSVVDADE
jgi:hypothetical protein